jgi:glycerol-3-phosphate acyltransferase PlsY
LWGLPAAVLGHTYPLFTGFRGGKGVATAMGGLLGVMPECLLIGLVTWAIVFYSTRYVAVASIGFGLSLPICSLVLFWSRDEHWGVVLLAFVVMAWIVWRHRSNLARLREGTENRFERKKNG